MSQKRILIIGWADSVHIQKWCIGLMQRGFKVKLLSSVGQPPESVDTLVLPKGGKLSYLKHSKQATQAIRAFKPDIVHAHYVAGNGWLGLKSGIRPLVVSVWGSDIDPKANNWFVRRIVKRVLQYADHITATSEFLKTQIESLIEAVGKKLSVIPFGVEIPAEYVPIRPSKNIEICYLKNHRAVYGADVLIKAMAEVSKHVDNVILNLAGKKNEFTQSLKRLVRQLELDDVIRFTGEIEHPQVYEFIRRHHFMVMPSISEAFGVAAAEAAACGRAVVASKVGGIPEVVFDGKTGILISPNDHKALAEAIIKLAKDNELCGSLGRAGYDFVKLKYSWNESLDSMCNLYERLIDDSKKN